MDRKHRFRVLKPHLMQYIHNSGVAYEPVFRDLLHQERLAKDELAEDDFAGDVGPFTFRQPHGKSWEAVFDELSQILSPIQIQQLASRLLKDTRETCLRLHEMAEIEKILVGEFGGEG